MDDGSTHDTVVSRPMAVVSKMVSGQCTMTDGVVSGSIRASVWDWLIGINQKRKV